MLRFRSPLTALLLAGLLLPAAATSSPEEEATPVSELDAVDFPLRDKAKQKNAAVDSLAFSLFRELVATHKGNVAFSPAALEKLLQTLREGAAGKSRHALDALPYGAPDDESARHVHSVSALFADESLAAPATNGGPLRFLPFAGNAQAAAEGINQWCREACGGNIPGLLTAGQLGADTRLLAANATFMHKHWLVPISPANTLADAPFTRADGSQQPLPLMQLRAPLRCAAGQDWKAVALGYRDRQGDTPTLVFLAILPRGDARDFARKLDMRLYDSIRRALTSAEPRPLHVALPRFEVDSSLSFRASLSKLGAASLFGKGADFSPLLPGESRPALADVLQRCRLSISESKSAPEAPALGPDATPELRFDRPFLWAVDDLTTGAAPAFMGLWEEPGTEK